MSKVGQPERVTQNRVIDLFRDELGYRELGNLSDRSTNSNIEGNLLARNLTGRGYSNAQASAAIYKLQTEAGNANRSLYDNNEAVYSLLRYGHNVKTDVAEKFERVHYQISLDISCKQVWNATMKCNWSLLTLRSLGSACWGGNGGSQERLAEVNEYLRLIFSRGLEQCIRPEVRLVRMCVIAIMFVALANNGMSSASWADNAPGVWPAGLDDRNAIQDKISSSDVVVYGLVQQLMPATGDPRELGAGFDNIDGKEPVPTSNSFKFHVISTLKGTCQVDIDIDQAPSGQSGFSPSCGQGDAMLFFLRRDGQRFLSVPPTYEIFLPKASPPPDTLIGNCYIRVISYLLFAMSDPTYGPFASRFLGGVFDPTLIDKIKPFATNYDRMVCGEALYFLAHNQVVEAIPLVRKAQEEAESQNGSLAAPLGLGDYFVPAALPLLNPTLFSTSWQVRLNAETSIIRFHRSTSIPYLMVALYDPEKQNIVAYRAYYELSKYMGFHPISLAQFYRNRAKADIPVFNWWRAELLGKHVRASQATAIVGTASPEASPSERLFNSDIRIRQAEMSALEKGATADDVPYLMLALHDPDADLSYRAYKTLFALLKLRSEMASETSFIASPDLTTQPIYIWWQNHFVDN